MPEFNEQFQEALDQIEMGLGAFENLLGLSNGMSQVIQNFDVFEDVEDVYNTVDNKEGHTIFKDFIRVGLDFVKGHPDARLPELDVKSPEKTKETSFHLSQVESIDSSNALKTPIVKEEKVEEEHEAKTGIKTKTKKRKSKERRRERLLKYHEKLVKTNGLPPSRLMKQRLEQESSVLGEVRKNLSSEFEYLAGSGPSLATLGLTPCQGPVQPTLTTPPVLMPGQAEQLNLQPFVPKVLMPGWSEPKPLAGMWGGQSSMGVSNGSASGFLNQPSLPSTTHSSMEWSTSEPVLVYHQPQYLPHPLLIPQSPPLLPQPQPVPPGGRPAYCFHCLQYGAVYSINPVC